MVNATEVRQQDSGEPAESLPDEIASADEEQQPAAAPAAPIPAAPADDFKAEEPQKPKAAKAPESQTPPALQPEAFLPEQEHAPSPSAPLLPPKPPVSDKAEGAGAEKTEPLPPLDDSLLEMTVQSDESGSYGGIFKGSGGDALFPSMVSGEKLDEAEKESGAADAVKEVDIPESEAAPIERLVAPAADPEPKSDEPDLALMFERLAENPIIPASKEADKAETPAPADDKPEVEEKTEEKAEEKEKEKNSDDDDFTRGEFLKMFPNARPE